MSRLTKQEIETLIVYAMTAWYTFKKIHYTEIKQACKDTKFLHFSPNGQLYWFSNGRTQKGISVSLKGLKMKSEVRDALITQINYIVDEYNTKYCCD